MEEDDFNYSEIYKLYLDRLKVEGDWIWSRFKLYMTLNTGTFAAIGLLFSDMKFDLSLEDFARLIVLIGAACIGRKLAIEWTNINIQGRFWENVFTWHVAQIEKKMNKDSVNLCQYLDECEKSENYVNKNGMDHIVKKMGKERKDPLFSNKSVSETFKLVFDATLWLSVLTLLIFVVLKFCSLSS